MYSVTMEWWTDLWLNEGFASYTEYIGTDHVDPDSAILGRTEILRTNQNSNKQPAYPNRDVGPGSYCF
jgi:aminopeptidase N